MVIIHLKGGLGNQMFQYAFGRSLSIKRGAELKLDILDSPIIGIKHDIERPYLLSNFNINAEIATKEEVLKERKPFLLLLSKIWRRVSRYDYFKFDTSFFKKGSDYFEGFWWQSEKYFKDIRNQLLSEYTLKASFGTNAEKITTVIRQAESPVSIHIRRGDFASDQTTREHHGLLSNDYYIKAIELINRKVSFATFFIFSDDIEWVKTNLQLPSTTLFVSGGTILDTEELFLMTLCKHHVIANSSFSWWGAWLGTHPEKIVIAPQKWITDPSVDASDVYPEGWIKI